MSNLICQSDVVAQIFLLRYIIRITITSLVTIERSQSISSGSSGGGAGDRRSTTLDSSVSSSLLKKKDSYIIGQSLASQPPSEAAKDEGSAGTPVNTSFRPVTLTVQAFFKQVYC